MSEIDEKKDVLDTYCEEMVCFYYDIFEGCTLNEIEKILECPCCNSEVFFCDLGDD